MKNVQIIDGALNCTYSIFSFTNEEFNLIFPLLGQNVEFIEDVIERLGEGQGGGVLAESWKRPVEKRDVQGIHGTLFYELDFKKKFYPTKKEEEMVTVLG